MFYQSGLLIYDHDDACFTISMVTVFHWLSEKKDFGSLMFRFLFSVNTLASSRKMNELTWCPKSSNEPQFGLAYWNFNERAFE